MSQLDNNKLKVLALSIAEAGEFGLVRLITEEPQRAVKVLEDADFTLAKSKKYTEVTAIFSTKHESLSKITKLLGNADINIEYAYSSAVHIDGKVAMILRLSNPQKAEELLAANGVTVLSLDDMKKFFQ